MKKKKKNPNHKLKTRWGCFRIWLELVWELIRSSQLPSNTAEPAGRRAQRFWGVPTAPQEDGWARAGPALSNAFLMVGRFHP